MKISPKLKAWLVDTSERAVATFGETFLATFGLQGIYAVAGGDWSTLRGVAGSAAAAGAAAALTYLKGAIAAIKAGTVSPASFAPAQQPGQAQQDAPPPVDAGGITEAEGRAAIAVPVRTVVVPERSSRHGGRLGRHVHHDERSRAYGITPHPAPISKVWHRHVPPFDQGDVGSCTGNAMAGALSTAPFRHRFSEHRAVLLYEAATALDDVPGTYPPDDTGSSGLAVAKAALRGGLIHGYRHCFSLADVISALQDGPCIAGTNWYSQMDTPGFDGHVTVGGVVRGGHEYELVGVNLERRLILAVNSWGTSWGSGGYFTIGFDDFARLLAEQGDVTVPVL